MKQIKTVPIEDFKELLRTTKLIVFVWAEVEILKCKSWTPVDKGVLLTHWNFHFNKVQQVQLDISKFAIFVEQFIYGC